MIGKILVPLDGSKLAQQALPYASQLATALGASLVLLGVAPSPPGRWGGVFRAAADFMVDKELPDTEEDLDKSRYPISKDSQMASVESEVKRKLMPAAEQLQKQGLSVQVAVTYGRPSDAILQFARDKKMDLIVMCTHGDGGLTPYAYGGTADRVARRASVPVMLVRPEGVSQILPLPKIEEYDL